VVPADSMLQLRDPPVLQHSVRVQVPIGQPELLAAQLPEYISPSAIEPREVSCEATMAFPSEVIV
jgi:hypothetical protein